MPSLPDINIESIDTSKGRPIPSPVTSKFLNKKIKGKFLLYNQFSKCVYIKKFQYGVRGFLVSHSREEENDLLKVIGKGDSKFP